MVVIVVIVVVLALTLALALALVVVLSSSGGSSTGSGGCSCCCCCCCYCSRRSTILVSSDRVQYFRDEYYSTTQLIQRTSLNSVQVQLVDYKADQRASLSGTGLKQTNENYDRSVRT